MFLQPINDNGNNTVLGVRTKDYMTGFTTDLNKAVDNVVKQAQSITATVGIYGLRAQGNKLTVDVIVNNLAGHRFPSGVGFRRAFLEFRAMANGQTFFTSGTTNNMGQITDSSGKVLADGIIRGRQIPAAFQPEKSHHLF